MVAVGSVAAAHGSAATKATGGLSDGADNVRRGSILPLISARQNHHVRKFHIKSFRSTPQVQTSTPPG